MKFYFFSPACPSSFLLVFFSLFHLNASAQCLNVFSVYLRKRLAEVRKNELQLDRSTSNAQRRFGMKIKSAIANKKSVSLKCEMDRMSSKKKKLFMLIMAIWIFTLQLLLCRIFGAFSCHSYFSSCFWYMCGR